MVLSLQEKINALCPEAISLLAIPIDEVMIRYLKSKPMGMQTFLDRLLQG